MSYNTIKTVNYMGSHKVHRHWMYKDFVLFGLMMFPCCWNMLLSFSFCWLTHVVLSTAINWYITATLVCTAGTFQLLDTTVIRSMDHTLWPENPWFFLKLACHAKVSNSFRATVPPSRLEEPPPSSDCTLISSAKLQHKDTPRRPHQTRGTDKSGNMNAADVPHKTINV
jgi:hypothetical protein